MPEVETFAGLRPDPITRPIVVLAIDDDQIRAMCALAVTLAGFDVIAAERAATVHTDRWAPRPDIVVADVSSDSRHGWAFVRALKRDDRTSDIPVVAMAADLGAATRERARREGCAAVCPKTCPADVLASGIRAVLNGRR
jgi:two-component system chemotaxis response regulator CheY